MPWDAATLGLPRVVAVVYPDNLASRRILKTLGFASDGPCEYKGARVERYVLDVGTWTARHRHDSSRARSTQ
jgi:RimJ/RimL family protein N-acetyltransferase